MPSPFSRSAWPPPPAGGGAHAIEVLRLFDRNARNSHLQSATDDLIDAALKHVLGDALQLEVCVHFLDDGGEASELIAMQSQFHSLREPV